MRKWDGVWVRFVILSGPLEGEGVGEKKKENLMGKEPKTVTRRKFVAQTAGAVVSLGAAGALNVAAFALKVDARRFKEAYRKTPGKCWVPGMEWAEVVEAALAAEGTMR